MTGDTLKSIGWRLLPWMADLLCAMLTWWAVQVNAEIKEIRKDVIILREWKAETSGNRYTSADHVKYAQSQAEQIASILLRIADMQQLWLREVSEIKVVMAQLPKRDELPPQWFRDYVKGIETKIDKHLDKEPMKP